jgi:hypothetical protein
MRKLERLITELPDEDYDAIENSLVKSKAEKFLYLLRHYRHRSPSEQLTADLGSSNGALYALKSRLYDKIQSHISGTIFGSLDQVLIKLHEIPDICYRKPREVSVAFLLKLEEELKQLDMHHELVQVYSALKRMNLFSDSYFHYSQLYNKHIAFNLSIEKSEEILSSFNRTLRQYDFSRSQEDFASLIFLKNDIASHFALHQSRQIEIISLLVEAQFQLFAHIQSPDTDLLRVLDRCAHLIGELAETSAFRPWGVCVEYLRFEYLFRSSRIHEASATYSRLQPTREYLLLMTNVAVTSFFPVTEQLFLQQTSAEPVSVEEIASLKYDPADIHAAIKIKLAECTAFCYKGEYKRAAVLLNEMLNNFSLRELFHITLEVKLMLIFANLQADRQEQAESLLANLSRKLKADHPAYENVIHLFKVFQTQLKSGKDKRSTLADHYILFEARNKGKTEVLRGLLPLMKKIYLAD